MTTQKELPVLPDFPCIPQWQLSQWIKWGQQCAAHAREQAISETLAIAYGYADSLTWNDDFKAEIKALKGK